MELNLLTAISPIDGRYRSKNDDLAPYFSEYALIRYRVRVEVEYFISLCSIPLPQLEGVSSDVFPSLRSLYQNFSLDDAWKIKDIEKTTNHDVKAVEYFLKEQFDMLGLSQYKEFIHFGLTSQDINNTAIPLSFREAMEQVYLPMLHNTRDKLSALASLWENIPMLARTHGQPASPTRLGKEIDVFVERLDQQMLLLQNIPFAAKFGGATGNFNAHHVAYPSIDWKTFGTVFVNQTLGLTRSFPTTQVEHYDHLAAYCDGLKRLNTILIDLCRDIWTYISMDYFKQRIVEGEVGSSAMPHKVNPIDFENAEGNFGMANAIFEHIASKLPVSRLQRDLTDSTVLRNLGVPVAHSYLSFQSLKKGLDKLIVNPDAFQKDLERNWMVVSEGIQTILRREGYPSPYEALKALTRTNQAVNMRVIHDFVDSLDVSQSVKQELKAITPFNYTGI